MNASKEKFLGLNSGIDSPWIDHVALAIDVAAVPAFRRDRLLLAITVPVFDIEGGNCCVSPTPLFSHFVSSDEPALYVLLVISTLKVLSSRRNR